MSIITGNDIHIGFTDLYDAEEHSSRFTGEKHNVPIQPELLSKWLSVNTLVDEADGRSSVLADLVYASEPSQRITVRIRGVVKEVTITPPRDGENAQAMESLTIAHGGPIDKESFAAIHMVLYQIQKTAATFVSGQYKFNWAGMRVSAWVDQSIVLRRTTTRNRPQARVELLTGRKLKAVEPTSLRIGDEVDIPVWFDIWFPPTSISMAPMAFLTWDRLVILSRDN